MQGGSLLMAVGLLTMGIAGREVTSEGSLAGTAGGLMTFAGCALFVLGGWIERQSEHQRR